MNIRHLAYLTALAHEKHFGRAAARSRVTQPTLSEAIRLLEDELGVQLVERVGRRFRGLTQEGKLVVEWANRIQADRDAMTQELGELRQGLNGHLRLGVIPAAMPTIGLLTGPFSRQHPRVTIEVRSHTSIDIQRGLDDFTLDAAVTYLDNEPLRNVQTAPLYRERYVLISAAGGVFAKRRSVTWSEAASVPLCLLTPDMQNRRIINSIFSLAKATPKSVVETNSVSGQLSHVRFGPWATVAPHTFLSLIGRRDDMRAAALTAPAMSHVVGLVAADRTPPSPLARALFATARKLDLQSAIEKASADR